jgi:lipoprotein-anchoring transpeptidase ErfK/SrfK
MRRRNDQRMRRLARPAGPVVVAALAILVTACSGGGSSANSHGSTAHGGKTKSASTPKVAITPANGSTNVDPAGGITVTATTGTLRNVTVRTAGDEVTGSLSDGGKVWHSQWTLDVSQSYTVTATSSDGSAVTSSFRTLTPSQTFQTQIFEGYKQQYGVGMPIILTFSQPITNKAAVEQSLQVATSTPVVGAWYWDGSQTLVFRPRDYWPTGTTVSFTGHLNGVTGGSGLYGDHTLSQTFYIGPALVAIANTATHHTQIYYDGKLRYDWPISSGKPGDATPDGSYLTIEKRNPVEMVGPGYRISVPWSVRFTFSGDYYHDAYWSVGQQGFENVSHGCVNLSPADSEIYYKLAVPGDPITVVNSPKAGKWDNGWTEWFLTWQQFLQGSALHEAVQTGPTGSTFVDPSTLPASTASAPIGTSPADNAVAH